ncbi:MAG: hypothetical protein H7062_24840 [Candidatus Saccharimonas sp.]|nr:hypothetical protein [Planctomycetaceae bacterium]
MLILFFEVAVCVALIAAFDYGLRRKSELITFCAGLMLIPAGLVLLSEIMIDGFYRDLRSRRLSEEEVKAMMKDLKSYIEEQKAADAMQPANAPPD